MFFAAGAQAAGADIAAGARACGAVPGMVARDRAVTMGDQTPETARFDVRNQPERGADSRPKYGQLAWCPIARVSSGKQRHAVVFKMLVARHDCESFGECLGYEHAVERVLMVAVEL